MCRPDMASGNTNAMVYVPKAYSVHSGKGLELGTTETEYII